MRIKRLEIHGFKSFTDKTAFHFGTGMTAVVGPNGCGKSNIVDAVLWCMGEQSPKHLRGKDMQDVIFAGSESRPPSGMAEVSLIFAVEDKPEGMAAADGGQNESAPALGTTEVPKLENAVKAAVTTYSEIQVTRRLFRTGESEYLLNKTPCRLRDIHELFLDAGIGKGAYSIIEQGKVGMIVSSKPEDRRLFIEEAAGIAKFKSRKKQAIAKMEATEQNLLRVNDLVTELARQMGSLDRQAKKAERYKKLRDEIREIDLKVAAADHEKRSRELEAERAALSELKERDVSASAEIADHEGRVEVTRTTLAEEERELTVAQEALFRVNNEIKLDEQNMEFAARELDKLREQSEAATAEIARLEGDVAHVDDEIARGTQEREEIASQLEAKTAALAEQAAKLEESKREQKRLLERVEEIKNHAFAAMHVVTSSTNAIANLEKRASDLRSRLERGAGERDEMADRVAAAKKDQQDSASSLAELKQMKLGLEAQKQDHGKVLETLRVELKDAEALAKRVADDLQKRKSRLQSLTELQNSYEGYQKGVRAVMARSGREVQPLPDFDQLTPEPEPIPEPVPVAVIAPSGPPTDGGATAPVAVDGAAAVSFDSGAFRAVTPDVMAQRAAALAAPATPPPTEKGPGHVSAVQGVFGLVDDFLQAPQELELAVEAVLGDRLQAVLVGCHTDGIDAISFLREKAAGRGTFIPLDMTLAPETKFPDLDQPGVIGKLLDKVEIKHEFARVAKYLLGDVVVVKDLATAVELHKAHKNLRKTYVTLEGERVDGNGVMTGGSDEGLQSGLLQRKREIRELAKQVAELEQSSAQKTFAREQLARRIAQVEEALAAVEKSEREEAIRIVELEKDLAALRERLERDRQRQEVLEFEAEQLRRELDEAMTEKADAEQRIVESTAAKQEADAQLIEAQEAAKGVSAEIETLQAAETQEKVLLAELRSRRDSLASNLERLARSRVELASRIERLRAQLEEWAARKVELEAKGEELRASIDGKVKQAEEARLTLLEKREKFDAESLALREREAAIKALRSRLNELQSATQGAQLREAELSMKLEHTVQQVMERYNEDLAARWKELLDPTLDFEAARANVAELKDKMARLGEVNMAAIEELAEVTQRHDFLATQKADLENTLDQLKDAIAKINRTSKEKFLETFNKVNENFQVLFPKLFRGGKAHLVLTNEDDLLESGVDIIAMPPGKKLQNMNLLSGGEKALTAVSLIVAIFLVRPTPFCVLDEVDAPLDEANVGRYNDIVREMAASTQFIVITHNKRTMAVCDALYGITMEEPGVSKCVSVKFNGEAMQVPVADA